MLGETLMRLRKKYGYSQQEIADLLSVSRQTISNWEAGQGAPSLDKACELARIYQISLDELAGNKTEGSMSGDPDDEKKSPDLHILKSLVGETCILDCTDLDMIIDNAIQDSSGNVKVKILEVDRDWIKIEYARRKEGTVFRRETETIQKLLDLSALCGIALETCCPLYDDAVKGE